MSSGFARASAVACAALVIGSFMTAEAKPAAAPDNFARAHALLQAAYPELSGQGLVFNVQGDVWVPYDGVPGPFLSMAMAIRRQDVRTHEPVKPVLSAFIAFRRDQTLSHLEVDGEFVKSERLADIEQWAKDHEGASDAEIVSRLAAVGARFHQTNEMRSEVLRQSKRIGTVLGRVQLKELDLVDSPIAWRAEVFISTPVGRRLYGMLFEPFEGRLTAMRQLDN